MQAGRQAGRRITGRAAAAHAHQLVPPREAYARTYVACGDRPWRGGGALLRAGPAGFPCRISGQMMERECDLLAATPAAPGARGRGGARTQELVVEAGRGHDVSGGRAAPPAGSAGGGGAPRSGMAGAPPGDTHHRWIPARGH